MKLVKITSSEEPINLKTNQQIIFKEGYSPFIQNGTWWQYDKDIKGYVDTGVVAEGKDFKYEDFTDEQLEKLKPVIEVEKVNNTTSISIDGVHKVDITDGYTPVKEVDYFTKEEQESFKKDITPQKGIDYKDGVDGHSPIVTASKVEDITSVLVDGNTIATIKDGHTPQKGIDYEDGYTPVKGTDYFTSKEIEDFKKEVTPRKDIDYKDGIDGKDGVNGHTPIKGVDYFTSKEISDIESDIRKYIPTKVSELNNDKEFITNVTDNLINYYLKSEIYTKDEVQNIIGRISSLELIKVDVLPTENIKTTAIYLVPKEISENDNVYTEYIYIDGK